MADILVVDDIDLIRHLLHEVLTRMGHNVTLACNGTEALNHCQAHQFDLIILDYHMPDMNGLEVARRLAGKLRFILHTSDYDNCELRQQALKAGALGVIAKINSIKVFRKNLETFLNM